MLTDIGKTMGSMGDAYKPVLQAATKPRGDMSDPAHLQNLAQWASSNGDTAAASMYMSQAREAKSEQKEKRTMTNMAMSDKATMTGDMTAEQIAQSGDVTNLDRSIAGLTERMQGDFPSIQARNHAKANLDKLKSMREGAVGVQTQNHARAVTAIDAALADPSLEGRKTIQQNPDGTTTEVPLAESLLARKEEMLKDPEVQKEINAQKLEAFRAEQAQDAMEEKAYLDKNMPELREAVSDPKRADEIIASAPPSAQDALRQTYNSMRTFQEGIDNQTRLFDDVKLATNMDLVTIQVNQIPEELRAGPLATSEALRRAELGRDSEGKPLTTGHATAIKNAREAHTKALNAVSNSIGQQEYARRRGAETKLETEVEDLNNQRETFRPSDDAIRTRARMLAEENEDYVKIGEDKRGKGGRTELNIGDYMQVASSQLRTEHRNDIDKQIALKTGEEIPEVETPDVEGWTNPKGQTMTQAVVDRGLEKVGKKKFVKTLTDEGYTVEQITEMLGESPYTADDLKEVDPYRAGGRVSAYIREPNTQNGVRVRPASEIYRRT
jgi:hypothetical protein